MHVHTVYDMNTQQKRTQEQCDTHPYSNRTKVVLPDTPYSPIMYVRQGSIISVSS
jgi:hypothetical protein